MLTSLFWLFGEQAAEVAPRDGVDAEVRPLISAATQLTKLSPRSPGSRV